MIVRESVFRDLLRLFVWYPWRWLIAILPVSGGITLLRMMGDVHYAAARSGKKNLVENLARMLPALDAKDANRVVREHFRNYYVDRLLIFIVPRFGLQEVERLVEIEGLEHLDEALRNGRGVVLVHGHFGPVHLPLVALARLGYRIKQVGLPSDEGLSWIGRNVAFRLRLRYESKIPAEIIMADGFLRPVFQWLHENGVIMITGDGSGTEKRLGRRKIFSFFGHRVAFPLGPALLTRKTGAALLPMFILPGRRKLYRIVIERPLNENGPAEDAPEVLTERFIRRLEHHIALVPGYMHFLDRFTPGKFVEAAEPNGAKQCDLIAKRDEGSS
jgi:lauroyl/myristoyl acyltransferase